MVLVLLSLTAACATEVDPPLGTEPAAIVPGPYPDVPALLPSVHLIENGAFLRPHVPPYRSTNDGRLAIDLKKPSGTELGFYLFTPEKLTSSWITSPAGVTVLAQNTPRRTALAPFYTVAYNPQVPGNLDTTDHHTICDAWPVANPQPNPYPCADDTALDCYDVTVVSTYRVADQRIQLHGKPIRVKVSSPKTTSAAIAAIETAPVGAPAVAAGPQLPGEFGLEPMITADGRLLVMRLGDTDFGTMTTPAWVNPETGVASPPEIYDIMYTVSPEGDPPCDVTRWTAMHPVTHAHHDAINDMQARYGFAEYPLRDAKGVEFADGEDFGGSYPWIDRDGDNLFFTLVSSTLFYGDGGVQKRYATACVPAEACVDPPNVGAIAAAENDEQFRGFGFAGLWSRGKVVMLDNLANNTDYGLARGDETHRMVTLYNGAAVRVGTGRDNGNADKPSGAVDNTSFIDSWEQLFNHDPDAHPTTVRDVVWLVNTGKATVEVAFDDYLDADGVIVSEMTGATSQVRPFANTNQPTYFDGFDQTGEHLATYVGEAEVANAATSLRWQVPPSGILLGGGGGPFPRIEPVALGGIVGKGLWFNGIDHKLSYDMPLQAELPISWTVSMFVDPRFANDGVARTLMTFPDGTVVELIGLTQIRYRRGGFTTTRSIAAHPLVQGAWNHLAWTVYAGGRRVDLYRDGYPFSTWLNANQTLFGMFSTVAGGPFLIGGRLNAPHFKGWIDEVKVFARDPGYEVMCNLGHGTLAQLVPGADATWDAVAARYTTHVLLRTLLGTAAPTTYACVHDYANPDLPLLDNLPLSSISVRHDVIFPEGPLHATSPRPPSDTNAFCLGCHVVGQRTELSIDALIYDGATAAQDDPRRQPMQTPPRLHGNVPLDFFVNGNPAFSDGRLIDPYVIP